MLSGRVGARLWVVALAFLVVATACGSDPEAEPDESVAATTAPTTTTTLPPTTTTTLAVVAPDPIPIAEEEGWELVWNDEFDGDTVNLDNWTYDVGGWGWGNGEAQYYTTRPENARVQDGLLVIEARFEPFENSYYTSARLKTQGLQEFQYGRFEARMKVPPGAGTWPAFWMLGANFDEDGEDVSTNWPNVGEIDVMEYVGKEPDLVVGTIHGPGYAGATGFSKWNRRDYPVADEFHTFMVEWDFDGIRWFYDGEMYGEVSRDIVGPNREWVYDHEFFMILNLALGGTFPGPIGLDTEFPAYLFVDYVRVYQRADGEGG